MNFWHTFNPGEEKVILYVWITAMAMITPTLARRRNEPKAANSFDAIVCEQ